MRNFFLLIASIVVSLVAFSQETAPIFYNFPNSGTRFEALYANPTNGTACIGDFNEDGCPDLIVMGPNYDDFTTSFVNLLLNNGDGTFTRTDLGLTGLNNGSITFIKTGTKQYLLAAQGGTASPATNNNAVGYVAELKFNGNQAVCTKKQDLTYGLINGDIFFVDLDNDGKTDIVQFGGGRKVYCYLNNGSNSFTLTSDITGLQGTSKGKSKVLDINGDGLPDIVCIDESYGLYVYLNSGNKTFTAQKITSDYSFKSKPRFEFGDFDKDGKMDIVAFDSDSMTGELSVVFFYGDGTGNFTQAVVNDFMGVDAAAVAVADFNGDGNPDVLYAGDNAKILKSDERTNNYTKKAYILLGDGNRNFTQHVKSTPVRQCPDIFCLAPVGNGEYHVSDFDGDGKSDIFALGELGIGVPGKIMRQADLFLSSLTYGFGTPVVKPLIDRVWQGFPYSQVRLGEGRLQEAMNKNISYLKSLDVNRLFASTLSYNLGITGYTPYGGWEESGYGSSFAHYLSAVSMAYAATGDQDLLERANRCVEIISASQDYNGDGFMAFKDGTTWGFDKMAKEKIITPYGWDENGHPWGNNDIGFPLYAHHKIFAALRDAYLYTGNEDARISFLKFNDWLVQWMQCFDQVNFQKMLESEHGGFVETLSDAYALSGKQKYLDAARKFTRENFAQTMSTNVDDLSGRHSNFHIPMAVGAAIHYLYSGDVRSEQIAHNFFHIVHDHHTLCNGGNGNNERFGTPDLLTYRLGVRGPETCSSYNMLKLAKDLFEQEGDVEYMDYYENTMYNHILAVLSPKSDAGVCYHVSLKPGTFKMYDNLYNNFWCCVGTGMESNAKYVDAIYFKGEQGLLINLFTPSTLNWEETGLKLKMETDFPVSDDITLKIEQNTSFDKDIYVRYPEWAEEGSVKITINGADQPVTVKPGELIKLTRTWQANDEIKITIPCKLRLVDLPDDINVSAIFYGPVLLAADLGSVGQSDVGESSPANKITNPSPNPYFPELKGSRSNLESFIQREAETLEFKTTGLAVNYTFKPFYDTHHCRYNVYWKIGDDVDLEKEKQLVADRVLTGVTESENAHNVVATGSGTGDASFNFWGYTYFHFRDASMTGSISYDLNLLPEDLPADKQYYLQLTYFGSEPSNYGNFRISINGTNIAYQGSISYLAPLDFAQRYYAIPRNLTDGKQKITVKFFGGRLSLYGLKLTTTNDLVKAKKEMEGGSTPIVNPTHQPDALNLYTDNGWIHVIDRSGATLQIINLRGQIMKEEKITSDHEQIPAYLPSGLYLAKCISSAGTEVKKVIVK